MADKITNFFEGLNMNPYVAIIIIAMIPIVELRGAIPVGYAWLIAEGYSKASALWQAFAVSFIGSSIVVPFLLLCLIPILNWMKKTKIFRKLAEKLENRFNRKKKKLEEDALKRAEANAEENGEENASESVELENSKALKRAKKVEFAKYLGLALFVGIPLPGTGCWTGSAIGAFLGLDFKKSLLAIIIGNLIAGLIMTILSLTVGSFIF